MPLDSPHLPAALRSLVRWRGTLPRSSADATRRLLARIEGLDSADATLPALAELLVACRGGFADLDRRVAALAGERPPGFPPSDPARVDPRLVVSRLPLALRALRRVRGLTAADLVHAASSVTSTDLKAFEASTFEPTSPSPRQLDQLLLAMRSGYDELERYARDPLLITRHALESRDTAPRLVTHGSLLSSIASRRIDLAVRALRTRRGWSREVLSARSGLPLNRCVAIEDPCRGQPPSEAELDALLDALGADVDALEKAAIRPLATIQALRRRIRNELKQRRTLTWRGRSVPPLALERFDLALRVFRAARGWSRSDLAEASGLTLSRLGLLERPGVDHRPLDADELERLLGAFEIDLDDLCSAARFPLRKIEAVHRRREEERLAVSWRGEALPRRVLERADFALVRLRIARGLSQAAVARASGLPRHRIADLETARSGCLPTEDDLAALLPALDATREEFLAAALDPEPFTVAVAHPHRPSPEAVWDAAVATVGALSRFSTARRRGSRQESP